MAQASKSQGSTFKDLRVWQEGLRLATEIYRATATFPRHELFALGQQMRRAAVSIPSNIAEGKGRRSDPDFCRFLLNARGSLLELQTQIIIAQELQYLSQERADSLGSSANSIGRGLNALLNALDGRRPKQNMGAESPQPATND